MKIIDLSIPIESDLPSDPEIQIPRIQDCNHKDTAEQMAAQSADPGRRKRI